MQVHGGALRAQQGRCRCAAGVQKSAQRGRESGAAVLVHAAVPDEHGVGLQVRAVGAEISRQGWTRDLLLALDDEAHVDGEATRSVQVLSRLDARHVVALVVGGAASPQLAAVHGRLERRRLPPVDRVDRLDVVMAVHRQVGLARPALPVGDHHGQAALDHVHDLGLHAHGIEAIAQPPRIAQAVFASLGQRADRGDAQLFDQVVEVGLAAGPRQGDRCVEKRLRRRHAYDIPRARVICAAWSCAWTA